MPAEEERFLTRANHRNLVPQRVDKPLEAQLDVGHECSLVLMLWRRRRIWSAKTKLESPLIEPSQQDAPPISRRRSFRFCSKRSESLSRNSVTSLCSPPTNRLQLFPAEPPRGSISVATRLLPQLRVLLCKWLLSLNGPAITRSMSAVESARSSVRGHQLLNHGCKELQTDRSQAALRSHWSGEP